MERSLCLIVLLFAHPPTTAGERRQHAFDETVLDGGFFHKIANGETTLDTGRQANGNGGSGNGLGAGGFHHSRHRHPLFELNGFASTLAEGKGSYCRRPARCELLNYTTCMGTKLPYTRTTLDLIDGVDTQEQAQEQLNEWKRLIHIPKCWSVIQPFLCALYMPKCEDDQVYLPSQEMCKMIMGPCRIVATYEPWPSVFRCDNTTRYPPKCKNDVRELKFNTTGRCLEPLVPADHPSWYFPGVDGCGVQCDDPKFLPHDREYIHKMVAGAATLCGLFNLFTVVTFMIDWKFSSKYPALVIFYINLCFLVVCLGWLAQFMPGGREDIVCRKDGTRRLGEPSASENLSCVIVYVMVYYFLMAGIAWFVILTYACYISIQALGKIQECMEKKGAYFHMVAWSLPLVLTITTMAIGEIDGDSVTGICFVGTENDEYRAGFLLLPVAVALVVGTFFLIKGLVTLIRLKLEAGDIISKRASSKIRETIFRIVVFSVLAVIFGTVTFICHVYEFVNNERWDTSFRAFVLCQLGFGPGNTSECKMSARPSLAMVQLHILSLFASGILMSTWVWTRTTLNTWSRCLARLVNKETDNGNENQIKPKKHKLIAQAYSKTKELKGWKEQDEKSWKLSVSFHSSHEDPVGLDFELNSGASGSIRSSWAAALPKLVTRRGALVATTNSISSSRQNSVDSVSYSVRRVSVESRRHSIDSAVSVKVSEVTQTLVKKKSTPLRKHHHKSRTRRLSKNKTKKTKYSRHSASISDSNNLAMLMLTLGDIKKSGSLKTLEYTALPQKPKMNRRHAGLDSDFAILAGRLMHHDKRNDDNDDDDADHRHRPSPSSSGSNSSASSSDDSGDDDDNNEGTKKRGGGHPRDDNIQLDILKDINQVEDFSSKDDPDR